MSSHLLSLPVELFDTVISFLVYPIDAYNLSRTCRYLHTHLKSQCNSFWYNIVRMHIPVFCQPYSPERDHFSMVKRYLSPYRCHLCLAYIDRQEGKWLRKVGMGQKNLSTLGVRVCYSCFVEHTVGEFTA